jgi:uncharacterized protein GlcG (DUF336 family)
MPKLVLVGDGAGALTKEVSRRKAYTAAMLKVTTGDFAQRVAAPGAFNPANFDPQLTTAQGAVPIKIGDDTIVAIAASGTRRRQGRSLRQRWHRQGQRSVEITLFTPASG